MRVGLVLLMAALALPSAAHAQATTQLAREMTAALRGNVDWVEADDPDVNAAIAQGKRNVPDFLAALSDPDAFNITFKFPLGGYEHIWVINVRRDGDYLTGVLDNAPIQKGWAKGDAVRVPVAEISDFFFCDADSKPHGHYTTKVFLDREEGAGFTATMLPKLCEVRMETNDDD